MPSRSAKGRTDASSLCKKDSPAGSGSSKPLAANCRIWLGCVLYTKSGHLATLHARTRQPSFRSPLPADSRTDQRPGPRAARDRPPHDRPSRPGVRQAQARRCWRASSACSRRSRTSSSIRASGTGAWEAALVNTLSPGDRVLMAETGQFATLVEETRRAPRAGRRLPARRLAPGRRSRGDREAPARGQRRTRSRPCASSTTRRRPA